MPLENYLERGSRGSSHEGDDTEDAAVDDLMRSLQAKDKAGVREALAAFVYACLDEDESGDGTEVSVEVK